MDSIPIWVFGDLVSAKSPLKSGSEKMCIIVYKPQNQKLDIEYLKNCWNNNSDGAGIMYRHPENRKIIIVKGFMNFDSLQNELKSIENKFSIESLDLALHFRIATHGGISASLTHPFPIKGDKGMLRKTSLITPRALMHNGIISSINAPKNGILSDTALFARQLSMIQKDKTRRKLIHQNSATNRFLLMDGEKTKKYGRWIEESNIWYSNESYAYDHTLYWKNYSTYASRSIDNQSLVVGNLSEDNLLNEDYDENGITYYYGVTFLNYDLQWVMEAQFEGCTVNEACEYLMHLDHPDQCTESIQAIKSVRDLTRLVKMRQIIEDEQIDMRWYEWQ